jgi:hypothetical protein
VEVGTSSGEWIGAFECYHADYVTGLFGLPSYDHLLVLAYGTPYVVAVSAPGSWRSPPVHPVVGIRGIVDTNLLTLWGFQDLAVYGAEGLLWTIKDFATDDLVVTDVSNGLIRGTLTCAGTDQLPFQVRANTGEIHDPRELQDSPLIRGDRTEPIASIKGWEPPPKRSLSAWPGFERDPLHRAIDWVLDRIR